MLVLVTSMSVFEVCKKVYISFATQYTLLLKRMLYIYYQVQFKKNPVKIQILLNFASKINAIILIYIAKLSIKIKSTNIGVQKANIFIFKIFEIVFNTFQVKNKLGKIQFFQKTILLLNTGVKIIIKILFLTFSYTNILFVEKKLTYRLYISAKALLTTKQMQIISYIKLAAAVQDLNKKVFVFHKVFLS